MIFLKPTNKAITDFEAIRSCILSFKDKNTEKAFVESFAVFPNKNSSWFKKKEERNCYAFALNDLSRSGIITDDIPFKLTKSYFDAAMKKGKLRKLWSMTKIFIKKDGYNKSIAFNGISAKLMCLFMTNLLTLEGTNNDKHLVCLRRLGKRHDRRYCLVP